MAKHLVLRRRTAFLVALLLAVIALVGGAGPALAAEAIITPGALTRVEITEDLNCAVDHVADERSEFYLDTACATLVATGGTLYGPAAIPAGDLGASPRTTVTAVSQSAVTGAGTAAEPFRISTVVDLGTSGLRVTETDSYVAGQESYRTDVALENRGGAAASGILYRAGDCFLQNSDVGFGVIDEATGAVACLAQDLDNTGTPGDRIEQWLPLTAGSSFLHAQYAEVWGKIGAQEPFDNTCRCDALIDNGAGLSWNFTVAAGASASYSHLTTFSPLGQVPLTMSKAADEPTSPPGGTNGYMITVTNGNEAAATLDAVVDTLPDGFGYVAGSTTGATTTDPAVSGQELTWTGPFEAPAGGAVTLAFDVTVASQPGTYTNEAGATSADFVVSPTGPTAPIEVTDDGPPPPEGPVDRVAGLSRIETAVEVSMVSFPESATTVVLARADTYPDALAGAPLARSLDAPILLTSPAGLHPGTRDEINRLGATRAVLLGGENALSAEVATNVVQDTTATQVDRIGGASRFDTAALIAAQVGGTEVYVAEGFDPDPRRGWPDALAASSVAAFQQRPILLVDTTNLPEPTRAALDDLGITAATLVGGEAAVSAAVQAAIAAEGVTVERLGGRTRYETAGLLAQASLDAGMSAAGSWIASGENFPDALVTGPAAAKADGVLMLVHPADLDNSPPARAYLEGNAGDIEQVFLLGGPGAISPNVEAQIGAVIG